MKPVPIKYAEAIADRIGAQAVVILTFDGQVVAGTSYGATKAKCRITGKWMDNLIDAMSAGILDAPKVD